MASLFFTCPTTHQQAPTGIETDVRTLSASWRAMLKVHCPHCGGARCARHTSTLPYPMLRSGCAG
jgi:hypothetical protein